MNSVFMREQSGGDQDEDIMAIAECGQEFLPLILYYIDREEFL